MARHHLDRDDRLGPADMIAHLDRHRTAARCHQPHPAAIAQAEGCGLQFVADGMTIEGEAERIRTRLEPRQMQFQQPDAIERVEGHGFNEVEASISQ